MNLLPDKRGFRGIPVGVSSTTYAQRKNGGGGAAALSMRVAPSLANSKSIILVDTAGQSDLLAGMSAAALLAAAEDYWTDLANRHSTIMGGTDRTFHIVVSTVIPIGAIWGMTGAMEAQRLAYNDMLRAIDGLELIPGVFVHINDIASAQAWNPLNVAHYSDQIHPADGAQGVDLYAASLAAVIEPLLQESS